MHDATNITTNSANGLTDSEALIKGISEIDSIARSLLTEIDCIASLALLAMESPATYARIELLAQAFIAIRIKVSDGSNLINAEAERLGGHSTDSLDSQLHARSTAFGLYRREWAR